MVFANCPKSQSSVAVAYSIALSVLEQAPCSLSFADDLHVVVQQNVGVVSHLLVWSCEGLVM
jgi:hypothetical protein